MSGFLSILNIDAQPIDRELLQRMTSSMVIQRADALDTWIKGNVGFGHTLLRTTWESQTEEQPCSLDGKVWITGDIRLDRRDKLQQRLITSGCNITHDANDVELVLHAYQVWSQDCLDHISGDFAFVIWDDEKRSLFSARDHFGIVPVYYVQVGNILLISNSIKCLRLHPQVSDRLNNQAIADFLLFAMNMELNTTSFADIQKLPQSHQLTCSSGKVTIEKYWQLPTGVEYLRYKNPQDYVEQFKELFTKSVADRLRTDSVGTHLSGGLDSTSIATVAYKLMSDRGSLKDFRSYAIAYQDLLPDEEEGKYAQQVAAKAGFPVEYLVADEFLKQAPAKDPDWVYPEPLFFRTQVCEVEINRRVSSYSRVLLAGFGGDPGFEPDPDYWRILLQTGQLKQFSVDSLSYLRSFNRLPRYGFGLRKQLRSWLPKDKPKQQIELPDWYDSELIERSYLEARLESQITISPQRDRYGMVTAALWSNIFAWSDPGFSGFPVKVRFPFFDLSLVLFLLSVPPVPWFESKFMLREAMKDFLPDSVRQRKKSPLPGNPHYKLFQQRGVQPWMEELAQTPALSAYVDNDRLLSRFKNAEELNISDYRYGTIPLVLAQWLKSQ